MVSVQDFGFKEEIAEDQYHLQLPTGYPEPIKRYRLILDQQNLSIEEMYYWILSHLQIDHGFHEFIKITDVFAASEQSAFWGVSQQRLGLQQDKASQFLAVIGKMVKELFQLVRELRVLDEKLSFYEDSATQESAEIALKGWWIDLVEGGAKNPASVYGMSTQVGFATLPDLFFSVHPKKSSSVDHVVNSLKFNRKVKEVLKRKLKAYLAWKEHTHKELKNRRKFTLKYLRQHYDIIKMYNAWVKPYLRYIKRLHQDREKQESVDLVMAFEGSIVEIEFLAKRQMKPGATYHPVILASFYYRSRPYMNFQQEGFQRGPVHTGRAKMELRSYVWSDEQIEKYRQYRDKESFELLSNVDGSVRAAMDALGEELENYLREAGEDFADLKKDKDKEKKKTPSMLDPFSSVIKGFGEMFNALFGVSNLFSSKQGKKKSSAQLKKEKASAKAYSKNAVWQTYKNYKKAHRMITW
ncbi:hypothetical protein D6745_04620 [Candidatus Woesearchaeota archaeon]|nr:MAG: hypothetical protein D6745_04620 [Candidatus Woesearchaeota archaeon]